METVHEQVATDADRPGLPVIRRSTELHLFEYRGQEYEIDEDDFLVDQEKWDKNFAEGMATRAGIGGGLFRQHWDVLEFIRRYFSNFSECPKVHKTCMALKLRIADLEKLFPTGYRRGACKLAGLCYHPEDIHVSGYSARNGEGPLSSAVYRINVRGFLVDPAEWTEDFAVYKWNETKMPFPLNRKHWQIIKYLRAQYERTGKVPTVYDTCRENNIDIEELGMLFPDGYHRGAVKIAGLSG